MSTESWAEYVRRVTRNMTQAAAAELAGVNQAAIGRWIRGTTETPRAESVIAFARALEQQPIQALVAAGFITEDEAPEVVHMRAPISDYSNEELMDELNRRIKPAG